MNTTKLETPTALKESKKVFEQIAQLSMERQTEYRFDQADANGLVRKFFYFGDLLVGLGEDVSAR